MNIIYLDDTLYINFEPFYTLDKINITNKLLSILNQYKMSKIIISTNNTNKKNVKLIKQIKKEHFKKFSFKIR